MGVAELAKGIQYEDPIKTAYVEFLNNPELFELLIQITHILIDGGLLAIF